MRRASSTTKNEIKKEKNQINRVICLPVERHWRRTRGKHANRYEWNAFRYNVIVIIINIIIVGVGDHQARKEDGTKRERETCTYRIYTNSQSEREKEVVNTSEGQSGIDRRYGCDIHFFSSFHSLFYLFSITYICYIACAPLRVWASSRQSCQKHTEIQIKIGI